MAAGVSACKRRKGRPSSHHLLCLHHLPASISMPLCPSSLLFASHSSCPLLTGLPPALPLSCTLGRSSLPLFACLSPHLLCPSLELSTLPLPHPPTSRMGTSSLLPAPLWVSPLLLTACLVPLLHMVLTHLCHALPVPPAIPPPYLPTSSLPACHSRPQVPHAPPARSLPLQAYSPSLSLLGQEEHSPPPSVSHSLLLSWKVGGDRRRQEGGGRRGKGRGRRHQRRQTSSPGGGESGTSWEGVGRRREAGLPRRISLLSLPRLLCSGRQGHGR